MLSFKTAARAALALATAGLMTGAALAQDVIKGDGGTIRLMTNPAGTMSFPPFIIDKYDLDTKHGFTLEIVPYTSGNSITAALQSDSAEAANLDWIVAARLRNAGVPVLGVAPFMTYVNSVLVPVDSEIESIEDLDGKSIGVHQKSSFDWLMMQASAKKVQGMDLAEVVELHEAAPPLLRGTIAQGQLDATQMWNSIAAGMLASGEYRTLATIREMAEDMGLPTAPFLLYTFRENYLDENPQNVKAFVATIQEVIDIMMTDDSVWEERGAEMDMSPEAIVYFRDQVRRDLIKTFEPGMEEALYETFDILADAVGTEIIGMEEMPDQLITTDFQ